jgi:Beta-ketoacyl synthase, N-terminal domain
MRLSRYARAIPGHATDGDAWPTWVSAGARRRLDPLTRLACAAVDRLLQQGGELPPDTAVLVATSYGAVESTFKFAQSISAYGDAGGSPTPFTTSVHNSCAAAIGELLRLRGPTTTISQGATGTHAALRFAHRLVETGRAPASLVLAGERHNEWSRRVVAQLSGARWPIGDGMVGCVVEAGDGPGRVLSWDRAVTGRCLTGGPLTVEEAQVIGADAVVAADRLGAWWPGCGLAGLDWPTDEAVVITEAEGERVDLFALGPHR